MRISVIIPVYNAEDTLARCLDSVLAQSFRDYQVVVVDDGSTDGSLTLARRYESMDSRIKVLAGLHRGTGAARNAGLDRAEGEYTVYMDADDYWVRHDLLQELAERICTKPADVYMYQMAKVTEAGEFLERYTKPPFTGADTVLAVGDVYQDLVRDGQTLASACNKCVRRDTMLRHRIRFREDVLCEDIDWVLQLFSCAETICLMNIWAYAYTQHRGESRSSHAGAPNDLVTIMHDWGVRARDGIAHREAVTGLVAFEYGICMGNHHMLSRENKRFMRRNTHVLEWGMDRKTKLIRRFYSVFGFDLTCAAVRMYLLMRRIW